ncbi:MAG TPA: hypothetical protein VN814_14630 [Caulobacteraceae bacterium]|nr:hypothetical protein [Caulobacteraceae bacterium]
MRAVFCGVAAVLAAAGLSACNAQPPNNAPPAASFELVSISGTANVDDILLKINMSNGQTWAHCCESNNATFTQVADAGALPAGDYHITSWASPDANGKVTWMAYRVDRKTGHTWYLGCQQVPNCSWYAMTP